MIEKQNNMRGFTLIEVIVVVAILAIMTGVMVPMVYRVWESNDQELTSSRLKDLQIAIIGDSKMFQNGVRTHFGYVGDIGMLPSSLQNLVENTDALTTWKGPYLPSGYDTANYAKDAWGRDISYVITATDADGRNYAATLKSAGPDGILGSGGDDIEIAISIADVLPLASIQGNLMISNPTGTSGGYSGYIGMVATYRDGTGNSVPQKCCSIQYVSVGPGSTVSPYFDCTLAKRLPIGTAILTPNLYTTGSCDTIVRASTISAAAIVSTGTLFTNLQLQ